MLHSALWQIPFYDNRRSGY